MADPAEAARERLAARARESNRAFMKWRAASSAQYRQYASHLRAARERDAAAVDMYLRKLAEDREQRRQRGREKLVSDGRRRAKEKRVAAQAQRQLSPRVPPRGRGTPHSRAREAHARSARIRHESDIALSRLRKVLLLDELRATVKPAAATTVGVGIAP